MRTGIKFGDFLPDGPDFENPGLTKCQNVYPTAGGAYGPYRGPIPTALSVTGTIIGAKRFNKTNGSRFIVCATTSDLYVIDTTTSFASGLGLSLAGTDRFVFDQFEESIYATTKAGSTYVLTNVDTDTTFSLSTGSPPSGNAMARVGDFMFMGDLTDLDASDQPYRVRWSQFNNPDVSWVTDVATQAGFVGMPKQYGPVTGITGGDVGLILQKFGVSRIMYVGGNTAFNKEIIDKERGCTAPSSIVQVGPMTYYAAHDGFCRTDGSEVQIISTEKVWSWFSKNSDAINLDKIAGAVNWVAKCVVWVFYGTSATGFTKQLIYNWEQDRWSSAEISIDYIVEGTQDGVTLEGVSAIYPDIDLMSLSLDSPVFKAQGRMLSAFIGGVLYDFLGNPLEAIFETGDFQPKTGARTFVSGVVPLVENIDGNTKVAVATRNLPGEAVSYSSDTQIGSLGFAPFNADGRYVRARITIPVDANWVKASGVQIDFTPSGVG